MIKNINTLFVTMFGLGRIPKIPGTFGSLATVILLYIFFHILNLSPGKIFLFLIIVFIFSFIAVAAHIKDNENKDPKEVIIDEFIGQSIPIYLYEIVTNLHRPMQCVHNYLVLNCMFHTLSFVLCCIYSTDDLDQNVPSILNLFLY